MAGSPISTQGIKLMRSTSGTGYTELCRIKDYPDLIGDPNLIEVTDLQDTQQTNILGVKTSGLLTFTSNYTKEEYEKAATNEGESGYYALQLSDGTGWKWQGSHTLGIPGHGVDEAVEFTVNCINSTPVERFDSLGG